VNRATVAAVVATCTLVALQLDIVSPWRISGVVIMIVWLWPVAFGVAGATGPAVATGVLAGLLFDARTVTPYGLTAIVGALLGLAAARLGREGVGDLDGAAWWMAPLLRTRRRLSRALLFAAGGFVTGQSNLWRGNLGTMMVVNAAAFFVLARPLARVARVICDLGGVE
jgi:hypothetical protein